MNAHLLSISLSKDDQDWQSVFHTHHFTEIFFVLEGKGNFLFREGTRSIRTGDLIIIPPYIDLNISGNCRQDGISKLV